MKLTRLELSGFKSFADTVQLTFEEGITSIVGPNGCGKSNISDAVRWVLGEQRARILRGARMDEVIFQGTAKRRPVNFSQVSLYFDNADGELPLAYHEVVVTRRLNRNGQSDYLINQQPVRLRDVQDLLRGTGLASDAGVVIEAQKIDRLLSDRPDERRALFEEAAGIGLYRDRKTTTERRLERTLDDLQRLDDLISEVQTQVRSLARQRGKADRHKKLTVERFGLVMTLTRRELTTIDEQSEGLRDRRRHLGEAIPSQREALAGHERARGSRIQDRASAEARRTEVERRLSERRLEAGKLEGDLNLAAERLQNATARRERALDELNQVKTRANQARHEQEAAAEEWKAASVARESVQTELDLRAANEQEARDRLERQREMVRGLEGSLQQRAEAARALAGEQTALERELQDLRKQTQEWNQRREAAADALNQAQDRLRAAQGTLSAGQRRDQEAQSELESARHALVAAKEAEAALLAERRAADDTLAQLSARREALEALERDRAGIAPAARKLLAARDRFTEGAVLGPLSDFLRPSQERAEVTERTLAEWLHAVLVRDPNAIEEIRRWHEETQPGPLLLLPTTPGPSGQAPRDLPPEFALGVSEPAAPWASVLLTGHEPLDAEGRAIRRPNGAVFLPAREESSGPLQRRAELDSLTARVETAQTRVAQLERGARNAAEALERAETEVARAGASAEGAREAIRTANGAFDDASREAQRAERERREAEATHARMRQRLEAQTTRAGEVREELRSIESSRAQLEAELEKQRSLLANLESEQEAAREHRVHWQVEEAQVSVREDAARERETRAREGLERAERERAQLEREIADIEISSAEVERQRAAWTDLLAERRTEVVELETAVGEAGAAVAAADEALAAQEQRLHETRESAERMAEELHGVEIELTEITGRRQAVIERVQAEWHQSLDDLLNAAPELDGDEAAMREEAARLEEQIQNIGPVNPLAAQEHDEERKRLEFLETQREDLIDARGSLVQALREIDETARKLFVETFDGVRENFERVFLTLFEVGECDVRLADPANPLESDIEIRAAPRGKRTQRIHLLSSGERALVAISLLFAIFLAKPSPFCLLDEVDAPLDDANVQRFLRLLEEFKPDTQFLVITHNPRTMQTADAVYGVTMQEPGISTIVGVRLGEGAIA